jgi:periplasmic divalent cation tolerance protein
MGSEERGMYVREGKGSSGGGMTIALVMTTFETEADARNAAEVLIEERLAACVQIVPCRSVYRWEGAIEDGEEFRLDIKTDKARIGALLQKITDIHPYDEPELLVFDAAGASPSYAAWVNTETVGN